MRNAKRLSVYLGLSGFIYAVLASMAQAENPSFSPATPKDTDRKFYYSSDNLTGLEGWTWIHYEINTEGRVVEPLLINHSEKSRFIENAFELLEDLEFNPATLNGSPVESSRLMFLRHARNIGSDQNKSAGENFAEAYGEVIALIGKNDLDNAEQAIQTIKDDFKYNLVRQAWLAWVTAMLNFRDKDYDNYLYNLTVAGYLAEDYLSNKVTSKLYMNLFEMQMYSHRYLDAQDTIEKMINSDKVSIDNELADALSTRVEQRLATTEPYSVTLELGEGKWRALRLNRNKVTLHWEQNVISGLKLRCEGRNTDYLSSLENAHSPLTIESEFDECVLLVKGTAGEQVTVQQ